uniref:DNA-directed RNA polymerase subunit beta'' n=1 Tax=Equisetum xylochaetum TaxID=2461340 RepID=UPI002182536C|nr:DNA-directed RNA polymerase subunit beta'' [Equisetum xylochaetum]UVF28132.1 DNA-directed RNA polymerase subunit beta'' [Equisetum xylochaetum]
MADQAKLPFYNRLVDKTVIKQIISRLIAYFGVTYTTNVLDQLKTLGFQQATKASISLGIDDLVSSPSKTWLIRDAEQQGSISEQSYQAGGINAVERLRQLIETWYATSEYLKREMNPNFNISDPSNPVHMMSFSGARGSISQIHQLVGMRGLMSDPQGQIIDLPIQSNFREGLSLSEYIISCYGARKGVVDTAVRTADAGYLTRRLVEVVQHIVVRKKDCKTFKGISFNSSQNDDQSIRTISHQRLIGRVLAESVYWDQRCIAIRNQDISNELAIKLVIIPSQPLLIRSPLVCKGFAWVCQLCYGWSLNQHDLVELSEAVGIIAGQSIGEPGTQLTLRTFHTGGVFTGDIAEHIRTPISGIINFNPNLISPTRTRHGYPAWICEESLPVRVENTNEIHDLLIPSESLILIQNNHYIEAKQIIAEVRTANPPIKETVEKNVYSNLTGELHWSTIVCHLSEQKKSTIHTVLKTGHLWILSGIIHEFNNKPFYFYKDMDRIDSKKNLIGSVLLVNPLESRDDFKLAKKGLFDKDEQDCTSSIIDSKLTKQLSNFSDSIIIISKSKIKYNKRTKEIFLLVERKKACDNKVFYAYFVLGIPKNHVLKHDDIFAVFDNPEYQTNVSGIIRYGTVKVNSVAAQNNIINNKTSRIWEKKYEIFRGGTFFLIPEERYIVYNSSSILISNNSIIYENTQITPTITSRIGGLVQIKKIKDTYEIRILPGTLYYLKNIRNVYKKNNALVPPHRFIFDNVQFNTWTYLQWVTPIKKKGFIFIRPVLEYVISNDFYARIPVSSLLNKQDLVNFRITQYLLYRDGERVISRRNRNIQLVQTCLIPNWKNKALKKIIHISLLKLAIKKTCRCFLQISLTEPNASFFLENTNNNLAKCVFGKKPPSNAMLCYSKNQLWINKHGTIRLVSDEKKSIVMLSTSDFYRNLLFTDSENLNSKGWSSKESRIKGALQSQYLSNELEKAFTENSNLFSRDFKNKQNHPVLFFSKSLISETQPFRGFLGNLHQLQGFFIPKLKHWIGKNSFSNNLNKSGLKDTYDISYQFLSDEIGFSYHYYSIYHGKVKIVSIFSSNWYKDEKVDSVLYKLGQFVFKDVCLFAEKRSSQSGQMIAIDKNSFIYRLSEPYLVSEGTIVHKNYGAIFREGDTLITLTYERLKSSDIIQGLPKVEQLLEARSPNSISINLERGFLGWKRSINKLIGYLGSHYISAQLSLQESGTNIVDQIQRVYRSQGVQIADKHIEIIVRQMTSKVLILEGELCNIFLPGELIELPRIQRMNRISEQFIVYKPIILGITKASLNTTSFLAEASFQETTRVLAKAAIRGRVDWLKGLKENVIVGRIIPAGTGSSEFRHKNQKVSSEHKKLSLVDKKKSKKKKVKKNATKNLEH